MNPILGTKNEFNSQLKRSFIFYRHKYNKLNMTLKINTNIKKVNTVSYSYYADLC